MKRTSMKRFVAFGALAALTASACSSDKSSSATTAASVATTAAPATTVAVSTTAASTTTASSGSSAATTTSSGSSSGASSTTTAGATSSTGAATTLPAAPANLKKGGTLKLAIDGEAACYVPSLCSVSYGPGSIRAAVLDNLVDPAQNAQGYALDLATAITPNAGFTEFTVKLQSGVKWSDGTPFVAGDVKSLFDTYVLADKSAVKGNLPAISSVTAPDDSTVVFTLAAADAPFPQLLTIVPIWKPTAGLTQTSLPVGTGPFMFASWQPNVATKLVRNPNYAKKDAAGNQLPYLDGIDVTAVTSGDTRVNAIQSNQDDLAMSTDPLVTADLGKVSTVNQLSLNAGGGIFFNTKKAPTDDVRIRQALSYATNKKDILAAIGGGDPRDEYYVPTSPWYSPDASKVTPAFDTAKAKQLLDEYINDPARSDGQPVGTPLSIELKQVQGAITQDSITALAQQEWGDVGVKVTITPEDQSTLIGDAVGGNYQATYFGWATPSPYSLLTHNYGPPATTPTNFTHFDNADLASIITKMAVAKTTAEMNDLVFQSNMIFAQLVPVLFLHSTTIGWAATKKVGNIQLDPGNGNVVWPTLSLAG
ncbi:MAG: putative Extracellular solute-binding protein [Ilumatobacteraceae bacterium]|nr:putative Extracellular solute-binding protein [Ilumatobacteraceae bacterium]